MENFIIGRYYNQNEWDNICTEFSSLVKKKQYRRIDYVTWTKVFTDVTNVNLVCSKEEIMLTINAKNVKTQKLKTNDESLGQFLFDKINKKEELAMLTNEVTVSKPICGETGVYLNIAETNRTFGPPVVSTNVVNIIQEELNMRPTFAEVTNMINESKKDAIENNKIIKRENKNMKNFNFDFGPCTNDNIRMSMYGLAIQNNAGVWVSYNNGQIVDVDVFNFDGRQYMFKMPVAIKDIKVGDIVIHNRVPMFVTSVTDGVHVVDIRAGEEKTIVPTTNMFGFNFITKIVSMLDAFGSVPTAEQPFGNMLPFMLMDENKDIDPMMLFLMMKQNNGDFDMNNPMMLYFMFGKEDTKPNWMLPLMLMNNQRN